MAELINMPKLGFDMQEGQLVRWLVKPGDRIEKGTVVAEIESDKATVEVETYTAGTVLELLVNAGDWVPIGAPIAIVGEPGEQVDRAALGLAPAQKVEAAQTAPAPAPVAAPVAGGGNGQGLPGGVRASPLARKMAADLGLDLARVPGSGPQGRITRTDVEAFVARSGAAAMPVTAEAADQVIPLARMRARIGQRMVEAKQAIPHFYITTEIDMGPALDLRRDINARLEEQGIRVSVNDMVVRAVAMALKAFPNLNASFNGDSIVRHAHINIGIAVALPDGLINVVSRDADQASLSTLAQRHAELIARAREGRVRPEDVEGETFAISNLGPWDVEHFAAIINPPDAAVLALGAARQVPVVKEDGTLGVGWRMKATLSADHRVTDGAEAAAFMRALRQILEDPIRLLV